MSYVPDVSMFPYWKNKDAGGLVRQVKELSAQVFQYKEQLDFYENDQTVVLSKDCVDTMKIGKRELEDDKRRLHNKVKKLVEEKQELQEKVDEAQVIFQENLTYKNEINTIREAVENECQASGIMEVMNMRIEQAEKDVREQELLKFLVETDLKKEQEKCSKFVNDYLELKWIVNNKLCRDECQHCGDWVKEDEMEEVKNNDWENIYVCFDCRDNNYTECDSCREYVDDCNVNYNDATQQHICDNCNNSDNED